MPSSRYTLVIIDMQIGFENSARAALSGVLKAIGKAKKNGSPIVIVEYVGSGQTFEEINQAVVNYGMVYRTFKNQDNGSVKVINVLRRHKFSRVIRICGVNLDACVKSTIEGLLYYRGSFGNCYVTLIGDATNTNSYNMNDYILRFNDYHPRLALIGV